MKAYATIPRINVYRQGMLACTPCFSRMRTNGLFSAEAQAGDRAFHETYSMKIPTQ